MKFLIKIIGLLVLVIPVGGKLSAQETPNFEFGNITAADFNRPADPADSGASAVILADIGKTYFEKGRNGIYAMEMVYTRFERVKIINKSGFGIAKYEIGLNNSANGKAAYTTEIKGETYNMVAGTIQKTPLDASAIFEDNVNKYFLIKKFTMPALKEGSIYDITYTIRTLFVDIRSWVFQNEYPCKWSECVITVPHNLGYETKIQGVQPFFINSSSPAKDEAIQYRWVKRDVKPIRTENNISSIKNYIDKISFQRIRSVDGKLTEINDPVEKWKEQSKIFFSRNDLGESLDFENYWLEEDIKRIIDTSANVESRTQLIYNYIRDNFVCTSEHAGVFPRYTLKEIYKSKTGSVSEINLLLIAMLRHYQINANPAILSTRANGYANLDYPDFDEYDYLICIAENGEEMRTLDASRPQNPYGRLPTNCYNGGVMILSEFYPREFILSPDSLTETEVTNAFFMNGDAGDFTGSLSTTFGNDQSYHIREQIKKSSKEAFFKERVVKNSSKMEITMEDFDSLDNFSVPLVMHLDYGQGDLKSVGVFYFSPIAVGSLFSNPFQSPSRLYPVEFPYKIDKVYILSLDIPKGFQIDEIPKSATIKLNEDQGQFDYLVLTNPDNIQMQVRLRLNRTLFPVEDYQNLYEFYGDIEKKINEKIVFKRVK